MIIAKHIKQPSEVKIFGIDCSHWLGSRQLDITANEYPKVVFETEEGSDFRVSSMVTKNDASGKPYFLQYTVHGGLNGEKVVLNFQFRTNTGEIYEDEVVFVIKEVG